MNVQAPGPVFLPKTGSLPLIISIVCFHIELTLKAEHDDVISTIQLNNSRRFTIDRAARGNLVLSLRVYGRLFGRRGLLVGG